MQSVPITTTKFEISVPAIGDVLLIYTLRDKVGQLLAISRQISPDPSTTKLNTTIYLKYARCPHAYISCCHKTNYRSLSPHLASRNCVLSFILTLEIIYSI